MFSTHKCPPARKGKRYFTFCLLIHSAGCHRIIPIHERGLAIDGIRKNLLGIVSKISILLYKNIGKIQNKILLFIVYGIIAVQTLIVYYIDYIHSLPPDQGVLYPYFQ